MLINETLSHWGRETHICVSKLTIIVSDNDLPPDWCQAIIWPNAGLLLIGPSGTNISEVLIEIKTFSLKKMHLKMSCGKCRPFCLGLNVLILISDVLWVNAYKHGRHDGMLRDYNIKIMQTTMYRPTCIAEKQQSCMRYIKTDTFSCVIPQKTCNA